MQQARIDFRSVDHSLISSCLFISACVESREESLELAKQLAATKADMHKLKQSAARLTSRVESAELMRADAEVAAEQLKQRLEKLLGSSQEVTKSRANMAQVRLESQAPAVQCQWPTLPAVL